jgi:pyridoxine/pyridoxamine 5'-phosphate oxidase
MRRKVFFGGRGRGKRKEASGAARPRTRALDLGAPRLRCGAHSRPQANLRKLQDLMALPPRLVEEWKELLESRAPESRWAGLATVAPDGGPSVRMVVWRGFDPERETLWTSAHVASGKLRDLEANRRGVILTWNPEKRVQWRISCAFRADIADSWAGKFPKLAAKKPESIDRVEAWKKHGVSSRVTFYWPDPGQPMTEQLAERYRKSVELHREDPSEPSDRFVVLEGKVIQVDRLELCEPFHKRSIFRATSNWAEELITA